MYGSISSVRLLFVISLLVIAATSANAEVPQSDADLAVSRLGVENCEYVQTGAGGLVSCRQPNGPQAFLGGTFIAGGAIPPYSVVKLKDGVPEQVVEAPPGEAHVLGCAQSSSTISEGDPVFVVIAGEALCDNELGGPGNLAVMSSDADGAGTLKSLDPKVARATASNPVLGVRLDGGPSPGLFWLFGSKVYRPTTILASSYAAALSESERFFPLSGVTTVATLSRDVASLVLGAGAVGQVRCTLATSPPSPLTIRLYRDTSLASSCTIGTADTSCAMAGVDHASEPLSRWALSAQLAKGSDDGGLSCTAPFTPAL